MNDEIAMAATDGVAPIQSELTLSRPGVVSYVWHLAYGDILIEVFDDGRVAVNEKDVECKATPNNTSTT